MTTNIASSKDSSKLATAAEELLKAAISHVETTSLTIGKETVEELKKLSLNSESVQQSIAAVKASFDSKLNTLNQSLTDLKGQMVKLNENFATQAKKLNEHFATQAKNQKLEWAISNAGINSFNFYAKDDHYCRLENTGFVRTILLSFRKGTGHYVTNRSLICQGYHSHFGKDKVEDGEKQFREALTTQIHELIGHKPRIGVADSGYAIYYS